MRRLLTPLAALTLLALAACDTLQTLPEGPDPADPIPEEPTPRETLDIIDLSTVEGAYGVDGVAIDKATGDVHVLMAGKGILIQASDGTNPRAIPFGEELPDLGYGDLDLLPDGSYVLAGPVDALRFDPKDGTLESYFCLVPGWEEIILVNQAVGLDPVDGVILAAPTYYDTMVSMETPSEAYHAQYRMDGSLTATVDVLASGVVAEGLARDPGSPNILAVDGTRLVAFTPGGQVAGTFLLEGIEDASGLAIDSVAEVVYVTDRADREIRTFDLASFR